MQAAARVVFDQLCDGDNLACSWVISPKGDVGDDTLYEKTNGDLICDLIQGAIAPNGKYAVGA